MQRAMVVVSLFVSGCVGVGFDAPSRPSDTPEGEPPGSGDGLPVDHGGPSVLPDPPAVFAPSPSGLKRLTVSQYRNSVRDLLQLDSLPPVDLERDTPVDGLTAVGASEVPISARGVEQFDDAARQLAEKAFAPATRMKFVGCMPASADDSCVKGFVARFGQRAFRRPLEPEEQTRYVALVASASMALGDVWKGLEATVAAFLESPHFLHRVELGTNDATVVGQFRYRGVELASRLSYFLWNTTPDEALMAAALEGRLDEAAGFEAQVDRLMASPRVEAAMVGFFGDQLSLHDLESMHRDPVRFPQATAALGASMRHEVERMVASFIGANADMRDMMVTRSTIVDGALAGVYGLSPPPTGFAPATFPDTQKRAGLLGTAGVLALTSPELRTSPTRRGVFVRRKLLCQVLQPPPPDVNNTLDVSVPVPGQTLRQRLEEHRTNPRCAGCHRLTDPPGLGLENYDGIGAFRTTDNSAPIDASADLDGAPFDSAAALGQILRDDARWPQCFAKRLYNHAVGRVLTEGDRAPIEALGVEFRQKNYRWPSLVRAVVASDGFRMASGPR